MIGCRHGNSQSVTTENAVGTSRRLKRCCSIFHISKITKIAQMAAH